MGSALVNGEGLPACGGVLLFPVYLPAHLRLAEDDLAMGAMAQVG